jgi:hypothetical protein
VKVTKAVIEKLIKVLSIKPQKKDINRGKNLFLIEISKNLLSTVRPRFWQLVGAAKMCGQNRVLQILDNDRKFS